MLGVEVSCESWRGCRVVILNKESRAKELGDFVRFASERQALDEEIPQRCGMLQFADAQVMGRIGKLALSRVRGWMHRREILVYMLNERLRPERPGSAQCLSDEKPVVIFTDGASVASSSFATVAVLGTLAAALRFIGCVWQELKLKSTQTI